MRDIAFFDLETTGTDTQKDRIVQICVKIGEEITTRLINPELDIPEEAKAVHGITNEMVKDAPTFKQLAKAIHSKIKGKYLAGFNSNKFDVPILVAEFARCGIEFDVSEIELIDVSNIYRRLNPRDLSTVYKLLTGLDMDGAHNAENDVLATEIIFRILRQQLPDDTNLDLYSNYDKKRIDLEGLFLEDSENNVIFGFGKHKGKKVSDEKGYLSWVINESDFPKDTKEKAKLYLNN